MMDWEEAKLDIERGIDAHKSAGDTRSVEVLRTALTHIARRGVRDE